MKRFLLRAVFFCMVCLCYAQQEKPVLGEGTEVAEMPAVEGGAGAANEAAETSEENREAAKQEHAEPDNAGTDTPPVWDETNTDVKPAKPKKKSFFKDGRTAFAFGIEASGSVANSYLPLLDLFNLSPSAIDFKNLSRSVSKKGLSLAEAGKIKLYLDIYLKQKYEFGFFLGVDTLGFASISKKFIDAAAEAMDRKIPSRTIEENLFAHAFAFADIGAFYGMSIKSLKFRVNASYYAPIFYLDPHLGAYKIDRNSGTGKLSASGDLHINAYTPLDTRHGAGMISEVLKRGGFDIDFIGSYAFNPYVTLQFSALHIPIVPAFMNKGYSIAYKFDTENPEAAFKPENGFPIKGPSADLPKKAVLRPLKISTGADIYPFANQYLIITPSIGFHCLSPFYVDTGLKLESRFLKVLGVYYAMAREDRIWKNRIGLFLDTRIFRLETFAASAGTTFVSSFRLKGAEAGIKLVFGY